MRPHDLFRGPWFTPGCSPDQGPPTLARRLAVCSREPAWEPNQFGTIRRCSLGTDASGRGGPSHPYQRLAADAPLAKALRRALFWRSARRFVIMQRERGRVRLQPLTSCRLGWLHDVFHDVFADLEPHSCADAGREAVVEACPDTGTRDLIGERRHVGKAMGHAR